jgi:hypothetical protein
MSFDKIAHLGKESIMKRAYPQRDFHYESMIGTAFKRFGDHLNACCLMNAAIADGCPASLQCREWWDNLCNMTTREPDMAEINTVIEEFEEARQEWLEALLPVLSHHELQVCRRDGTSTITSCLVKKMAEEKEPRQEKKQDKKKATKNGGYAIPVQMS